MLVRRSSDLAVRGPLAFGAPQSTPRCAGTWLPAGQCTALCGGEAGLLPEVYAVTRNASHGGALCGYAAGARRLSRVCVNGAPCAADGVPVLLGPPVLPPLNASAFTESDVQIRGGNVTISGIRVEGVTLGGGGSSDVGGAAVWADAAGSNPAEGSGAGETATPEAPRPASYAIDVVLFLSSASATFG